MNISFQNVSKQYKRKYALKDFTLEIENGVYGLLGVNGAGKTTLINIFVGILKSDRGQILADGVDLRTLGISFLSKIGYMPQYPRFYKSFEVYDFLLYISSLKGIPKTQAKKRAQELLEIVNLSDSGHMKIGALSGGMRQRVGIAQAMLNDPAVLILDEPTAGLDPQERIRFRNLITKFSQNRIVLIATHIVSDIEFIANKVLLIKEGQLLKHDSPDALMKEIEGKVWLVSAASDTIHNNSFKMKISNMFRDGDNIQLRVIDDNKPDAGAVSTAPNLEDVFLYYSGEGEQW